MEWPSVHSSPSLPKVGFIGAGVVGRTLGKLLRSKGYPVVTVSSRTSDSAELFCRSVEGCRAGSVQDVCESSDLIFLTVPDDQIELVASSLAGLRSWRDGQAVVHCSGALSLEPLRQLQTHGASIGSFHPLQSLPNLEEGIRRLPGSYFGIEAGEPLRATLTALATALGGEALVLSGRNKARYHLAATLASNYVVTLFAMAVDLLSREGISKTESAQALMPLLRGTVENLATIGLPHALTGPIARGDIGTVNHHVQLLHQEAPEYAAVYRSLGMVTVPLAVQKGTVRDDRATALRQSLNGGISRCG